VLGGWVSGIFLLNPEKKGRYAALLRTSVNGS
jgi:hypothetical protein